MVKVTIPATEISKLLALVGERFPAIKALLEGASVTGSLQIEKGDLGLDIEIAKP